MSKDYWSGRDLDALNNLTEKNVKDVEKEIVKYYKSALKDVINSMGDTYTHLLDSMVKGQNPTPADLYKLDKYWMMEADIKKRLDKLGNKQLDVLHKWFIKEYEDIYNSLALTDEIGIFRMVDDKTIKQVINSIWCADGKTWSERVWINNNKLQERLNEDLIHCVLTGKKTRDLKDKLETEFGVSYGQAKRIVDTEMAHIQTEAAKERYVNYGVEEVEVLVEKDACPECKKFIGKRFPIHGKMPVPAHPHCHCCIVPVIKNIK